MEKQAAQFVGYLVQDAFWWAACVAVGGSGDVYQAGPNSDMTVAEAFRRAVRQAREGGLDLSGLELRRGDVERRGGALMRRIKEAALAVGFYPARGLRLAALAAADGKETVEELVRAYHLEELVSAHVLFNEENALRELRAAEAADRAAKKAELAEMERAALAAGLESALAEEVSPPTVRKECADCGEVAEVPAAARCEGCHCPYGCVCWGEGEVTRDAVTNAGLATPADALPLLAADQPWASAWFRAEQDDADGSAVFFRRVVQRSYGGDGRCHVADWTEYTARLRGGSYRAVDMTSAALRHGRLRARRTADGSKVRATREEAVLLARLATHPCHYGAERALLDDVA